MDKRRDVPARGRNKFPARRLRLEPLEPRLLLALVPPALSSLPGANHSIYLDFTGHTTSGTTWNVGGFYGVDPIDSPAWSLDADRANFSATELTTIDRIWQRVSEDFAPFNVNVTTVEPPINDLRKGDVAGDTRWGVRAVISIETTAVKCGCGGIAYIGSFNDFYDEPVFVYNSGETGVAEAISHEVGHSLFLSHDTTATTEYYDGHGTGETSWSPIMGNSYNRNVTTFDQSEFFGATNLGASANYGKGADDLAVITAYNGFGYRPDDHGDSIASATALSGSGATLAGNGIISKRSDVDYFSFTTGTGKVTLLINPVAIRPNLDIKADLFDAGGNLLASSNPAAAVNASFIQQLDAGKYYLRIDGTGVGNPSVSPPAGYTDYGSIGQFTISAAVIDSGTAPLLSVDDVSVVESAGIATFTVTLKGAISEDASVSFATVDGTGVAPGDYTPVSGTLTFVPGGPTKLTVDVPIVDDTDSEPAETFQLKLSNASASVAIERGNGTGTIGNDDATIAVADTSVKEGNIVAKVGVEKTNMLFTISLTDAVDRPTVVSYVTGAAADTATPAVDYLAGSGSITIPAGSTSATASVVVLGDNTMERNETLTFSISSTAAVVSDGTAVGTIIDDDRRGGGGNGGFGGAPPWDFGIIDHVDTVEPGGDGHDHVHGLGTVPVTNRSRSSAGTATFAVDRVLANFAESFPSRTGAELTTNSGTGSSTYADRVDALFASPNVVNSSRSSSSEVSKLLSQASKSLESQLDELRNRLG